MALGRACGAAVSAPRSSATQRARQRSGAAGEHAVEAALAACERAGLGYLRKRPTATVMRGGVMMRTAVAGADYAGTLRGGRACYLEVKRVGTGERLSFSALRGPQVDELERVYRLGAVAAVVIAWGPLATRLSVVPWSWLRAPLLEGTPGGVALEAWRLPAGKLLLEARGVVEA